MAVSPEAGAFSWRPSGLSSSSLPPATHPLASFLPWTPGGALWRASWTPFRIRKEAPRIMGSDEAWVFRTFIFQTCLGCRPLRLPAPRGSAQSPCRTSHALKIPIVSLSLLGLCFLLMGDLCLFTQQVFIDSLLYTRHWAIS